MASREQAGLSEVPVIIRYATDLDVLELSLIENFSATDLNPIEEAQGYARLAGEFGMRQEDIAKKVGRSRAAVANAIRLLDLHRAGANLADARIVFSRPCQRFCLALKSPEEQLAVAETVLRRNSPFVRRAIGRAPARDRLGAVKKSSVLDGRSATVAELQ